MTPTPTPIPWSQNDRLGGLFAQGERKPSVGGGSACWGVVSRDGSRREATSPSPPKRGEPQDAGASFGGLVSSTGTSSTGSGVSAPVSGVKKEKEKKTRAATSDVPSPSVSLAGEASGVRAGGSSIAQPNPERKKPTESPPAAADSAKAQVSASELVACVERAGVPTSPKKNSPSEGVGRTVEMPAARPTLEEAPSGGEDLFDEMILDAEAPSSIRRPGVDRRRLFEPTPIEPPSPGQPSLPIGSLESCSEPSRSGLSSVTMIRGKLDPQLSRVIDAWPAMPQRTRDAILAMIDISLGKR